MTERERLIDMLAHIGNMRIMRHGLEECADYMLANGVIVLDTDHVDVVKNREPLRTAFNMPLGELAELIRAKQEGRVIVPPCKVGDTVYVLFGEPSRTIKEFRVRTIVFNETNDSIGFTNKSMFTIWDKRWYDFFGKIIFTTREEAEKALAERSKT